MARAQQARAEQGRYAGAWVVEELCAHLAQSLDHLEEDVRLIVQEPGVRAQLLLSTLGLYDTRTGGGYWSERARRSLAGGRAVCS